MKNKPNILFRKHPLGFTILQEKDQLFEPDDKHIFFHGQQLLSSSAIEQHGKLKTKKLRGLKQSEKKGRIILKNLGLTSESFLINPRYEECYFKLSNSYFSVTHSGQKIPQIKLFNSFVTNGCLFGTFIQGIQADGKKIPLIDHQLKIDSPVQDIIVENKFHFYELNTFNTLIKHISLMKKIGMDKFSIIYHLPVADYVLSGILRFIRGEMNFFALNKFIIQVKIRGNYHKQKLEEIARIQQVNIITVSPFDNLWDKTQEIDAFSLCSLLGVEINSENRNSPEENEESEKNLVKRLIYLLETNEYNPAFREIWHKMTYGNNNFQEINSIKDILSFGNASVIAYSTIIKPSNRNKTCAWLSAEEYPVFAHYKRTMSQVFGETICFSFLPFLLNYVGMSKNGSNQQTLFRYLPGDGQISATHNGDMRLPQNTLKLILNSDNYYIRIVNYMLYFYLYCLRENKLFFFGNFQNFHILNRWNENRFNFQSRTCKGSLVLRSKNEDANRINYYVLFRNNIEIKIKFKDYQEKKDNGYCLIL